MLKCYISVADKNSMYNSQIVSGFTLLSEQGKLIFDFKENKELSKEFFHNAIIEVFINDKRIIYDLTDGYNNYPSFEAFDNMMDNVDYYFKANLCSDFHINMRNRNKLFTLAPRYNVTYNNSPLNKIDYKKIINFDKSEMRKIYYKIPFVKNAVYNNYINSFEMKPNLCKEPKVFFYTRLWNPEIASSYSSQNIDLDGCDVQQRIFQKKQEYEKITMLRAGLVRNLKKEYGKYFVGGVAPDDFSEKYCPDLIGNEDMSKRKKYTKLLHSAQICVNTQGTHKCWNFSFGEELAASKAIVTEKPFYDLPTALKEDHNFYSYTTIDECINKVDLLFKNNDLLLEMMNNNYKYYQDHLVPDKYVEETLNIVLR